MATFAIGEQALLSANATNVSDPSIRKFLGKTVTIVSAPYEKPFADGKFTRSKTVYDIQYPDLSAGWAIPAVLQKIPPTPPKREELGSWDKIPDFRRHLKLAKPEEVKSSKALPVSQMMIGSQCTTQQHTLGMNLENELLIIDSHLFSAEPLCGRPNGSAG